MVDRVSVGGAVAPSLVSGVLSERSSFPPWKRVARARLARRTVHPWSPERAQRENAGEGTTRLPHAVN
eukprot:scaffold31474_cov33-Tisochrysis_lutea.AAC.2